VEGHHDRFVDYAGSGSHGSAAGRYVAPSRKASCYTGAALTATGPRTNCGPRATCHDGFEHRDG